MEAKGAYNMHRYGNSGTYICDTLEDLNKLEKKDIDHGAIAFVKSTNRQYQFDGKKFICIVPCTKVEYDNLEKVDPSTMYIITSSSGASSNIESSYERTNIDYENIFKEMTKRFNKIPITQHKCHNCGGTVEIDTNKHIFKCPYCQSVYAIGTTQINSEV